MSVNRFAETSPDSSPDYSAIGVDTNSKTLLSQYFKDSIVGEPLKTTGDGDCLFNDVNIFSTILLMTIFYINTSAPHPHPHHLPNPACNGYKSWKIIKIPNRYKISNKIFNSINFNNISCNFTLLCATLRYFTPLYCI